MKGEACIVTKNYCLCHLVLFIYFFWSAFHHFSYLLRTILSFLLFHSIHLGVNVCYCTFAPCFWKKSEYDKCVRVSPRQGTWAFVDVRGWGASPLFYCCSNFFCPLNVCNTSFCCSVFCTYMWRHQKNLPRIPLKCHTKFSGRARESLTLFKVMQFL